jgi:Putative DNA-binding domain
MSTETQSRLASALLDLDRVVPEGLTAWNLARPERRFGVYRNNYRAGLCRVLASRFPVTEKLVGGSFFAAMARSFITQYPPTSPMLFGYGDDFADFVNAYQPAAELAYLTDVVRLETALGKAYHVADVAPLEPAILANIETDILKLSPIEPWIGEDALVTRPHLMVRVQRLPPGGAAFLEALVAGTTLAAGVEAAVANANDFDLTANLAGLLQSGAVTAIKK